MPKYLFSPIIFLNYPPSLPSPPPPPSDHLLLPPYLPSPPPPPPSLPPFLHLHRTQAQTDPFDHVRPYGFDLFGQMWPNRSRLFRRIRSDKLFDLMRRNRCDLFGRIRPNRFGLFCLVPPNAWDGWEGEGVEPAPLGCEAWTAIAVQGAERHPPGVGGCRGAGGAVDRNRGPRRGEGAVGVERKV